MATGETNTDHENSSEESEDITDDLTYEDYIEGIFGTSIVNDLLPEDHIVENVDKLNEKCLHPAIGPIYKALTDYKLTAGNWALIFNHVLQCQQVPKHKLGKVYKIVFQTLTGKPCDDKTFEKLIPVEEKNLWESSFAERQENYITKQATGEHLKLCFALAQRLADWAKKKGCTVPSVTSPEFLGQLNFDKLANQYSPTTQQKSERDTYNYKNLRDELKIAEAEQAAEAADKSAGEIHSPPLKQLPISETDANKTGEIHPPPPKLFSVPETETTTSGDKQETEADYPDPNNSTESLRLTRFLPPFPSAPRISFSAGYPPTYSESTNFVSQQNRIPSPTMPESSEEMTADRRTQSIRIVDFLPNKYDPAKPESDPEAHFLGFRDYLCAQLGVTNLDNTIIPATSLDLFRFTLLGASRLWYQSLAPFDNIRQLEEEFLKEYAPDLQSRTTAAKALADLRYDRKSKLCTFVNKILRLNRTLAYDDAVLRDRFLAAMPSDIRRLAKLSSPRTFKEAIACVKQVLEDEETTQVSFMVQKEDDLNNTVLDMAMSIQSLKSEVDKIAQNMRNNDRRNERASRPTSTSRGRYYDRDNSYSPRRRYGDSPYRGRDYQSRRQNYVAGDRRGHQSFRGQQQQRSRTPGKRQYIAPQRRFDRSQIRCFNCNSLGHKINQCRRPRVNTNPRNQPPRQQSQYDSQNFQ